MKKVYTFPEADSNFGLGTQEGEGDDILEKVNDIFPFSEGMNAFIPLLLGMPKVGRQLLIDKFTKSEMSTILDFLRGPLCTEGYSGAYTYDESQFQDQTEEDEWKTRGDLEWTVDTFNLFERINQASKIVRTTLAEICREFWAEYESERISMEEYLSDFHDEINTSEEAESDS